MNPEPLSQTLCYLKNDITHATGGSWLSAGQDAGVEAVVQVMHVFSKENTKAVLLIDAENAFNSNNQKIMPHNMKFLCPLISTYTSNRCAVPLRLFIFGRGEILSKEGISQGDLASVEPMPIAFYQCFTLYLILF